jgi:lipooligosaccharide transport system permease protein
VALGEVTWALLRGTFYSTAFLLTMVAFGLTESWWAVLALPTTVLIGAAFAAVGLAASTYMRSFLDFDFVNLAITPMFLFSATFFPLDEYPGWIATVVQLTPLYQGVALCRAFTTGEVDAGLLVHVAYLVVMVVVGVAVAGRRIDALLRS